MVARLYRYQLPKREGLILQYNDGWGEIAPLASLSRETFQEALDEMLSLLPHIASAKPKLPSVQFGISSARTPFSLKPLKIPFCPFERPEENNRGLKIKVGHLTVDEAIELARRYKSTHFLRIDCNRKWSLNEALYFTSHFKADDFDYLEEPVRNRAELVQFSQLSAFPVAVDESVREGAIDSIPTLKAVVIKPMILGSIPPYPVKTVLSSSYESSLGHLLIARLATERMLPSGLGTFRLSADTILQSPLHISDGFLCWNPSQSPIDVSKLCLIASAP
jgi:O-succinylbenzoate synthase